MFKAIKEIFFQRHPHEDELVKLQQIADRAKQFEQSVADSMNATFNHSEAAKRDSYVDSDTMFK